MHYLICHLGICECLKQNSRVCFKNLHTDLILKLLPLYHVAELSTTFQMSVMPSEKTTSLFD